VVEWFQSSLRKAVGLNEGLTNTSRMLDRVQSVIGARLSSLEAAVQEQTERSNRVFSTVVAIGSLIALPPALLLAFFGVNGVEVNDKFSIFDFSHYWPAYVLAWVPFVALALMGYLLRRRIREVSPQLRTHGRFNKR
jgi:Mg2+ and Co2+ transporter CorA